MRIQLRVEQKGKTIFQAECDTERDGNFVQFARVALTKFSQEHPESRCSMMTCGSSLTWEGAKVSTVDRQMLLYHLVEAEQRVTVGKNDIQEQYRLIAELMRHGEDTVEAVAVLNHLIEAQEKHEADRDRLKAELAEK